MGLWNCRQADNHYYAKCKLLENATRKKNGNIMETNFLQLKNAVGLYPIIFDHRKTKRKNFEEKKLS